MTSGYNCWHSHGHLVLTIAISGTKWQTRDLRRHKFDSYTNKILSPFLIPAFSAAPLSRTALTCCKGAYRSPLIDLKERERWIRTSSQLAPISIKPSQHAPELSPFRNLTPHIESEPCVRLVDSHDSGLAVRTHFQHIYAKESQCTCPQRSPVLDKRRVDCIVAVSTGPICTFFNMLFVVVPESWRFEVRRYRIIFLSSSIC